MNRSVLHFAWLNVVLGATVTVALASPAGPAVLRTLSFLFPGASPDSLGADAAFAQLLGGIAGGIWVGWGLTIVGVASGWPAARTLRVGLLGWFAFDSCASAAVGAWGNVVGNLLFLGLGLLAAGFGARIAR